MSTLKTILQFCGALLLTAATGFAAAVPVLNKPPAPEFWISIAFMGGLSIVGLLTARRIQ